MPQSVTSAPLVKKLFEIATPGIEITAPEATFVSNDNKLSVTMQLTPAATFAGFAVLGYAKSQIPDIRAVLQPCDDQITGVCKILDVL